MDDAYYMSLALTQAEKAYKEDEIPIGCVIVKDDKVIAKSYNHKEKNKSSLQHAELLAIKKALKKLDSKYLDDCTLYVTIEPCMMCTGAIINTRIKKVVYGASNIKGGFINSSITLNKIKGINHRPLIESGILEKDCSDLMKKYFIEKRSEKYE